MAYIGNQPAESFTSFATQEFSTSATTSYTLDHAVTNENEIALFVNNVRQQPGSGKAYTATGTALTLSAATASTDTMYCVFLGRALQTVTPATNSITAAMVGNDLISGKDALTSAPASTDEFLVSDAGVLKRVDASLVGKGKILQVVSANESANHSITSTSYVNSSNGLTLDITPSATSSKIFIMVSIPKFLAPSGQNILLTVYRASSNISGSSGLAINGGFNENIPAAFSILDSPSSTSSLTYQVYAKTTGGTSNYGDSDARSTITAFEIGA